MPVAEADSRRDKVDPITLDHFISFITSSDIIKDLPFGQKTLKLQTGEVITIPNVVRSLTASSVIKQYNQLCQEEGVAPLGNCHSLTVTPARMDEF